MAAPLAALTRWATLGGTALLLWGCATTKGTVLAVKRIDRDRYEITSHVIGSPSGAADVKAKDDAVATKFCADKGGAMTVLERRAYSGLAAQDILTFRCGAAAGPKPPR